MSQWEPNLYFQNLLQVINWPNEQFLVEYKDSSLTATKSRSFAISTSSNILIKCPVAKISSVHLTSEGWGKDSDLWGFCTFCFSVNLINVWKNRNWAILSTILQSFGRQNSFLFVLHFILTSKSNSNSHFIQPGNIKHACMLPWQQDVELPVTTFFSHVHFMSTDNTI